jgi:hypothetical protein
MSRYAEWMNTFAYIGDSLTEGTVEEALLHFFHEGISPWIKSYGYTWNAFNDDEIASKFLKLCYDVQRCIWSKDPTVILYPPEPRHRDLPEDRNTFDLFVNTSDFLRLLEMWKCRTEIVGTRFDHLIREFCYVWINVKSGKPGTFTQRLLDSEEDEAEEEERLGILPDPLIDRRKYDLY